MKQMFQINGAQYVDHDYEGRHITVKIETRELAVRWQDIEAILIAGGATKLNAEMYVEMFARQVNRFELAQYLSDHMECKD